MRRVLLPILLLFFANTAFSQPRQWDRPMQVRSCNISVTADHFTATSFIEMEFYNPNNQEIEGLYRFELKPGQVITAFQLDLHGKYRDGSIEEKWKATNAYNTIVGKKIDPALLTMDYADHYSLRIYPVPAGASRKITMTIQQALTPGKNEQVYTLPLNIIDTVGSFNLSIGVRTNLKVTSRTGLISSRAFSAGNGIQFMQWNTGRIVLKQPLSFSIPFPSAPVFCSKKTAEQRHFALQFRPSYMHEYTIHPKLLTVLWDASVSSSLRDTDREISFLRQYISYHNIKQLTIITFNHKILDTAIFFTEDNFNSRWTQYLQNIRYDGSTQLGCIDLTNAKGDVFLFFTDGSNTYGKARPRTGNSLVYTIYTSRNANLGVMQQIVGSNGGKLVDLNKASIANAVYNSSRAENWLLNISSAGGRVITEQSLPLRIDQPLLINGTMPESNDTIYFHYGNNNHITYTEKISIRPDAECPSSGIDRITMLNSFDRMIRSYNWNSIIDYGLQEKIITPNTAYIVLERVEDYVKYNIAPPKELEEECQKMNYVKKDTRFDRRKIQEADEFSIIDKVVIAYNEKLRKLGAKDWQINLSRYNYEKDKEQWRAVTDGADNSNAGTQALTGQFNGVVADRSSSLDEVIVTGYGTKLRRDMVGSVTTVYSRDLSSFTRVEQALEGRVAGLSVTNTNASPGAMSSIGIRGAASVGNNNQPLYVLDGIPISGNINDIVNVNEIDYITVLKDIQAAALYGSRATNGAIVLVTKKGKTYNNYYNNKPYRLKDMEDVEYMLEIKEAALNEKMPVYQRMKEEYAAEPGFYFDIAQHFFESGMENQAFDILMNAAETANGAVQVSEGIGFVLESWKQFNEAILVYQQLVDENPLRLSFRRNLALACYQNGEFQRAVDVFFAAISLNTQQDESQNISTKAIMLNEMNTIISIHGDKLNTKAIPSSLIRHFPVDLRITLDANRGNISAVSIREPGGWVCSYSNPISKTGGVLSSGNYYQQSCPVEYQLPKALPGKYKISVNHYDYLNYAGKLPSFIRMIVFRNAGKNEQRMEVINSVLDNQSGEIEIGELKW